MSNENDTQEDRDRARLQARAKRRMRELAYMRRYGQGLDGSLERDMRRVNSAIYTLLLPVIFTAILIASLVLGMVPLLLLWRLHAAF